MADFFTDLENRKKERIGGEVDFSQALEQRQQFRSSQQQQQPGLNPLTRAKMSMLADNVDEARGIFKKRWPQGELTTLPGYGEQMFFRLKPDEQLRPVDPAGTPDVWELFGDIADVAGAVPQLAGETAAMVGTRGAGRMIRMLAPAGGGAAGEAARQVMKPEGAVNVRSILGAGAEGLAGGVVGEGAVAMANTVRGAGLTRVPAGSIEAMQAGERLGAPPLMPHQLSDNPIIRLIGRQSRATVPTVARSEMEQTGFISDLMRGMSGPERRQIIREAANAMNQADREIRRRITKPPVSLQEGGQALQEGVEQWWQNSKTVVDGLYSAARAVEVPRLDITPAQDVARQIRAGVRGARPTITERVVDPRTGVPRNIEVPQGTMRLGENPSPELDKILDKIIALDPNLPKVGGTDSVGQLNALMAELFQLSQPGRGGERAPDLLARRMRGELSRTMDNVRNTNPEFVGAWREARAAAKQRFDTRELNIVTNAARTETPEQLASQLVQPLNATNLQNLRRAMPGQRWGRFQEAARTEILRKGTQRGLGEYLDTFDKQTLNLLISPFDQMQLRNAGRQFERLERSGVRRAMEQQSRDAAFARQLVDRQDTRGLQDLRLLMRTQGANSAFSKSVRAGLIDNIVDDVMKVLPAAERGRTGLRVVEATDLTRVLDKYRSSGALQLLTKEDRRILEDVRLYEMFRMGAADAGTSLEAAQTISAIGELRPTAIRGLLRHMTIGRLFTSDWGRRLLTGTGDVAPRPYNILRWTAMAAGDIATDLKGDQEPRQERTQ